MVGLGGIDHSHFPESASMLSIGDKFKGIYGVLSSTCLKLMHLSYRGVSYKGSNIVM